MLLFFALFVPLKHAKGLNRTNINLAISTKTKTKKKKPARTENFGSRKEDMSREKGGFTVVLTLTKGMLF
jgi:hypothetical protein